MADGTYRKLGGSDDFSTMFSESVSCYTAPRPTNNNLRFAIGSHTAGDAPAQTVRGALSFDDPEDNNNNEDAIEDTDTIPDKTYSYTNSRVGCDVVEQDKPKLFPGAHLYNSLPGTSLWHIQRSQMKLGGRTDGLEMEQPIRGKIYFDDDVDRAPVDIKRRKVKKTFWCR